MGKRDPKFDAYVMKIHAVLDRLDYYRLLGVEPTAGVAVVRKAFYSIAAKFHPDRNRDAEKNVRDALYDIFKRLNEAYRVLGDGEKRKQYDEGLAEGKTRFDTEGRRNTGPVNPEDKIKNPQARQFYKQALADLEKGSLLQAELNIKVALGREKDSKVLLELAAKIKEAKQAKKKK